MTKTKIRHFPLLQGESYCEANYTIQCTDVTTGQRGCFLYDIEHWQATGEFKAVSPVCVDLYMFFQWNRQNGQPAREGLKIRRLA